MRRVVLADGLLATGKERIEESARLFSALRKHGEMQHYGRRFASFDRLPTASGETPELWFQLDVKHQYALQYTFSLRTDGDAVVQFQHMSIPFDSVEAREHLWSKLTQIDGLKIDKRLNGRPTFPIASLARPERLEQFVRIFSEAVDETLRVRMRDHPRALIATDDGS